MVFPVNAADCQSIAILGGGTIGASWAALFGAHGHDVRVFEPDSVARDRCRQLIDRQLAQLRWPRSQSAPPVVVIADLSETVTQAPWILECAPERLELKRTLFAEVERHALRDAVVASSSSALQPSELQRGMRHPERLAVAHPFNPPHLVPLVELVAGEATSPATVNALECMLRSVGKVTIRVRKELMGHVANRLTAALWREAVHLVEVGAASVTDIDLAVTSGPGLRWAAIGPHLGYHLAGGVKGIRHYLHHLGPGQEARWADLGAPRLDERTCELLADGVLEEAGGRDIDQIEQERDRRLGAILGALRGAAPDEPVDDTSRCMS